MTHAKSQDRQCAERDPAGARAGIGDAEVWQMLLAILDGEEPPARGSRGESQSELLAVRVLRGPLLHRARFLASEAGWPSLCPDPRCAREGWCTGTPRALTLGGPRACPGCFALALRAHLQSGLSEAEFEQVDRLLPDLLDGEGPPRDVDILLDMFVTLVRAPESAAAWLAERQAMEGRDRA